MNKETEGLFVGIDVSKDRLDAAVRRGGRRWEVRQHSGTRMVWGGRANVRSVLYMATVAAMRSNPVIKSFYQRLIGAGKKFKVAITACMRKLLTILNAMVRNGIMWQTKLERAS